MSDGPADEHKANGVTDSELSDLRGLIAASERDYLRDLEHLVDIDCGSYTKAGVDQVGRWVAAALTELGASVEVDRNDDLGDTILGIWDGFDDGPRALLIGHMDTVFEPGTATQRPYAVADGRAMGPGVTDMKSGLLAGIYALRAMRDLHAQRHGGGPDAAWLPFSRLVFIANPDEEIGSPVSSPVIRRHAQDSDLTLVLECARANGDIVSSRKGVADLHIVISGRAAHAGVEPHKGRSAVLEAAHKILALHALNGRWPGVTVNAGVVQGGTRPNVVAENATIKVDVRAVDRASMEQVEADIERIGAHSTVPDVTAVIESHGRHWPMEKLARSAVLFDHAVALARRLGFELQDAATGGASDANTTAGMGIATIDGLGPVGGGDHSPTEYLELASVVPRVTLLAALLLATGRDDAIADW
ncbi:M20 family metallopeptidase [soil metagenome]